MTSSDRPGSSSANRIFSARTKPYSVLLVGPGLERPRLHQHHGGGIEMRLDGGVDLGAAERPHGLGVAIEPGKVIPPLDGSYDGAGEASGVGQANEVAADQPLFAVGKLAVGDAVGPPFLQ